MANQTTLLLKHRGSLFFVQSVPTKKGALIRERTLKKYSHLQIENLIASKLNELKSSTDG